MYSRQKGVAASSRQKNPMEGRALTLSLFPITGINRRWVVLIDPLMAHLLPMGSFSALYGTNRQEDPRKKVEAVTIGEIRTELQISHFDV